MRGEISKDDCFLWKSREEFQVCEAYEFMSALRKENHIILIIGKHCPDHDKEHQNMHAEKGASSQVFHGSKDFDRNMLILENIYQRRQRRIKNLRNTSSHPNNTNAM